MAHYIKNLTSYLLSLTIYSTCTVYLQILLPLVGKVSEGRRTKAYRKTLCVVVILSGVTLDAFQPFGLHQEVFLRLVVDVG